MPDLVKLFLEDVEGRELLTEAFQYAMKLVMTSNPEQREVLSRTYTSLSQGRKVFRLFRFIPEALRATESKSDDIDARLDSLKHAAAASFYLIDHYVWLVQFALKASRDEVATVKKWKHRASVVVSILAILIHIRRVHQLLKESNSADLPIDVLQKDFIKVIHHSLRLWLSVHKLETFMDQRKEWSELKGGAIGLTSAIFGMANRVINAGN